MRGYKEEGTTTTPFDMVMMNDLDRFHLVMDVIDRTPGLGQGLRLEVAALIREHKPRTVYAIGEPCVHPDHVAAAGIARAAVLLARLGRWEDVPGGEQLASQSRWMVNRLFFPHCKMETPWSEFAFAVDISEIYARKRQALAAYPSILPPEGDRLLALYEADDQYFGRLLGVAYAEVFRSASPILLADPTVVLPGVHG